MRERWRQGELSEQSFKKLIFFFMAFQQRGKSEGSSIFVLWLYFSGQPRAEFSKGTSANGESMFIRLAESQEDNLGCM